MGVTNQQVNIVQIEYLVDDRRVFFLIFLHNCPPPIQNIVNSPVFVADQHSPTLCHLLLVKPDQQHVHWHPHHALDYLIPNILDRHRTVVFVEHIVPMLQIIQVHGDPRGAIVVHHHAPATLLEGAHATHVHCVAVVAVVGITLHGHSGAAGGFYGRGGLLGTFRGRAGRLTHLGRIK